MGQISFGNLRDNKRLSGFRLRGKAKVDGQFKRYAMMKATGAIEAANTRPLAQTNQHRSLFDSLVRPLFIGLLGYAKDALSKLRLR